MNASGNGVCRYRDWASFRYWFRAVEKYAPWVRYVHLVTWGHVQSWLNLECPKLKIVNHKDYMPPEYLPTYNCNPLELNLFRISGLSEHFVYFNDDMLLARPVAPEDFFIGGKPLHTAVALPWVNRDNELPYHLFFNTYGIANGKTGLARALNSIRKNGFPIYMEEPCSIISTHGKATVCPGCILRMWAFHSAVPQWKRYGKNTKKR